MRLLVVGGKLQGTEAVYLAAKAGWETVLVDRRGGTPAQGLAHEHVAMDVVADERRTRALAATCDAVLPACEDLDTLEWLAAHVPDWGVPLLFDLAAYRISSSKLASQTLFAELDVPRPLPWPACGFPAVVKPDAASGSDGVSVVSDETALATALASLEAAGHESLVEEYVAGPSLSLEVLAWDGRALPLQVTGLEFDAVYDCKRVVAPVGELEAGEPAAAGPGGSCAWDQAVAPGTLAAFDAAASRLGAGLGLNGLMDVEVMVRGGEPKVLEIDARLPSQTPTAVYWSCGLNIVELLHETVRHGLPAGIDRTPLRACVYQHVHAHDGLLEVAGEHVMGSAAPLRLIEDFFGADEALTDFHAGSRRWAATLIATGANVGEARSRADEAAFALARSEGLELAPEAVSWAHTEAMLP